MSETPTPAPLDTEALRASIRDEYAAVATEPERGFHFHTGRSLAALLGYHRGDARVVLPKVQRDQLKAELAGLRTPRSGARRAPRPGGLYLADQEAVGLHCWPARTL